MKSNDKNLTPQLRFPEFENSGEWEEKKLGEISSIVKEKLGKNNYTLLSITAGHGLVSQLEKFGKEIAGSSYENYIVIHKNDFAYNKSATKDYQSGYVALLQTYDVAAVPNSIFLCFRVDETILNVFFLEQLFKFNYHDKYLRKLIQIGARAHGSLNISNKDFFSMPIPIPPLKEQQKIADFLLSVDELVVLEQKKLEKLKEYKKGLLQNLFPKENQKVPDLRFPEFKNSGEWEEDIAKNIFMTISEKNHPELSVLAATQEYGMLKRDDIKYKIQYNNENTSSYKKVSKGDFVIHLRSFQSGFAYSDIEGITSPAYTVFRIQNTNKHYPYFWKYIFSSTQFIKKLELIIYGVRDGRSISFKDFSQFKFLFPQLKEQQKIADFLSSVDGLILEQIKKIEIMKVYKEGLLQNLFL